MAYDPRAFDFITQLLRGKRWRAEMEPLFWSQVEKLGPNECWPWTGRKRGKYGAMSVGYGATEAAHRLAFAFANELSPFESFVLHRCDNPPCCNPAHLSLGTTQDNTADKMAKGRHRTAPQPGERNPSARLSVAQVGVIRDRIASGETNVQIAKDYGVSHSMISRIRRGRSWGVEPVGAAYDSLRT